MSLCDTIASAIATAIQHGDPSCPVANIHNYYRYLQRPDASHFDPLFLDASIPNARKYHGWQFTQGPSTPNVQEGQDEGESITSNEEHWYIKGIYSLDDDAASEIAFRNIVEKVLAALRNDSAIINLQSEQVYMQSATRGEVQLAKALDNVVHLVELTLTFAIQDFI